MTTYTARASISRGANQTGGVTATAGQTVDLSLDTTVGVTSCKWEIYAYPVGFALPAGWTNTGGVYTYLGITPPQWTLDGALWGKYAIRSTVNGGKVEVIVGRTTALQASTDLICESLAILVESANGLRGIFPGETTQFSASWAVEVEKDFHTLDAKVSANTGVPLYLDTTDTPLGLWTLNGVLTDSSGGGYDLAVDDASSPMLTDVVPGMQGWACNGSRYLRVADAAFAITTAITLDAVVSVNTRASGQRPFASFSQGGNSLWGFGVTTNGLLYYRSMHGASVVEVKTSTKAIVPAGPCLVSCTRNAGADTVKFYVNGKLLDTITGCTAPDGAGATYLMIGYDNSTYYADGSICSVRITAAEKSDAQILAAYNASVGKAWGQRA